MIVMGTDHETLSIVTGTLHESSWFVQAFIHEKSEYTFDRVWVKIILSQIWLGTLKLC